MIELISYNIHFGKTLGKIVSWIKKAERKPDIVCFQEFPETKLEEFKKTLEEISYSFVFAPSFSKKKITYGELTAFNTKMLKLKRSKIIELGESKLERAIYRHKSHKSSLITEFEQEGKTFAVANVHLVILALHGSRKKQLAATIDEIKKSMPSLIVGDYNYSKVFGRKRGLLKFMHDYGYTMAGERAITHRIWKIPQQIDYAFYKGLKLREAKVGRVKYSDHYPILVKFEV